MTSTKFL
ncbi:D-alanyl-D-alanine carboxypeptidase domain protein, partial [Vibrio cholerae HC-28A1]